MVSATMCIKIYPYGLDDRSLNTLRYFFKKFCHEQCQLSDEHRAKVVLFNADMPDGHNQFQHLKQRFSDKIFIVTSTRPVNWDQDFFLRKPLVADHMLQIIQHIQQRQQTSEKSVQKKSRKRMRPEKDQPSGAIAQLLQHESASYQQPKTASDEVDLQNQKALARVSFNPDHYLLGYLRQALHLAQNKRRTIQLSGLWKPFVLLPQQNRIRVDLSERQLQSLSVINLKKQTPPFSLDAVQIRAEPADNTSTPSHDNSMTYALDWLIWSVALWTSRGRLPHKIDVNQILYLECWPNMTRLKVIPHALKIIALWIKRPSSLHELYQLTRIPQHTLFSLFTALDSLGLVKQAKRESDHLIETTRTTSDNETQNLFKRLLNKLKQVA